jgi:hypothetical protein
VDSLHCLVALLPSLVYYLWHWGCHGLHFRTECMCGGMLMFYKCPPVCASY